MMVDQVKVSVYQKTLWHLEGMKGVEHGLSGRPSIHFSPSYKKVIDTTFVAVDKTSGKLTVGGATLQFVVYFSKGRVVNCIVVAHVRSGNGCSHSDKGRDNQENRHFVEGEYT